MRVTSWAMLGSLLINAGLGLVVALMFTVAPAAQATETAHCTGHAVRAAPAPSRPAAHRGYVVAVRMGWAAG